jgi:hypothetical protein
MAIEIIRDLERQYWIRAGLFDKKWFKSVLSSKYDLQRTAKRIESIVNDTIPTTQFHTACVKFENVEAAIGILCKAYGLEEAAKKCPVEISSSADSMPVLKTLTALTQGIAVTDMGTISPWTGRPLCLSALRGTEWDTDDNTIKLVSRDEIQSRNEMYPLSIALGNETKENLVHMGVVHAKLTVLQSDATSIKPLFKPLDVNHKGDMSLQWKIMKKGCAAKKGNAMFCMCCRCLGNDLATPQTLCETCILRPGNPPTPYLTESRCHHHDFDINELQKYQ